MADIHEQVLQKLYHPNVKPGDVVIDTGEVAGNIDDLDLDRCDYMVIHNDGYEVYSVAGARQTIRKFKPKLLVRINTEYEMSALSDVIQFLTGIDLDYDYIINTDYHESDRAVYLYSWVNHGQRIAGKPDTRRIIGYNLVGRLTPEEIKGRYMIRSRQIPGSGGPDPDIYTIKFMPGRTVKYRRSKLDPWNSWYEFASEIDVRSKFWFPNIKAGDHVVDAGAGWGVYAITAGILGATAWAYEPHPTYVMDMAENVRLNGLMGQVHMFEAGLSDTDHITDWDELKNVRMLSLDEHLHRKIDYLKIDVEGQELEVLRGASQTIARYRPKILIEAHLTYNKNMLNNAAKIIMELADGYQQIVYDCILSGDCVYTYFQCGEPYTPSGGADRRWIMKALTTRD